MNKSQKITLGILAAVFIPWNRLFATSNNGNLVYNDIVNTLAKDPKRTYATRSLSSIRQIVIHHSATTSGSAAAYAKYHVENRGWPGIGYHFVIDKDGTINLTNYLETISYHVSGQNTRSIGICLTGNFDIQQPTTAQLNSVVRLIRFLSDQLGRLPIKGHNDYAAKSCPGNNISTQYIEQLAYNSVA